MQAVFQTLSGKIVLVFWNYRVMNYTPNEKETKKTQRERERERESQKLLKDILQQS